jgi:predicted phosphoribosyltransferase
LNLSRPLFRDRADAGRRLGGEVAARIVTGKAIVLALVRGGVPIGAEVAAALKAPLDIIVVRKLGVPWQPELAMGAIAGGTRVLDDLIIQELGISSDETDQVVKRETKELERREQLYRGGLPAPALHGRIVVLVDDGSATGSTMVAAVRHARAANPEKVIVAVPVGSPDACARLRREADECICLAEPASFSSVGEWYEEFHQVTDSEVQSLLKQVKN